MNMNKRARILLIEDAEDIIVLVTHILRDEGYTLVTATDGDAGLDAIRTMEPDVILLDMSLPRVSGWDVIRQVRAEGFDTPVLALTAHAMRGDRERALALGCTDYLSKPFEIDDLLDLLDRYTSG